MCGIVGFWGVNQPNQNFISKMSCRLSHRGPDDEGLWVDDPSGVALGHRRLSILDLSAAGAQPFVSTSNRYVLSYNGEIYNNFSLRSDIEKLADFSGWRGRSDTETLLAAIELWGVEKTLSKLNGMFAFALWDKQNKRLYLARDRFGEKPLYYGQLQKSFVFGSELKAIKAHPEWKGEIDRDALALFMHHNHILAPRSIYNGIKKLLPAHYVVISGEGQNVSEPTCYWSLHDVAQYGLSKRGGAAVSLADELDHLLRDAVGLRMLSDVPLGAFLSGGYDSTMIVAQMQAQSSRPVRTFSIGNEEPELDEARHAAAVAKHLCTDHTELYVTAKDALAVIPRLPAIYDEPFADSSQIPTFLVSQLARHDVTVALSGDGGDELFAGYNRHFAGTRLWSSLGKLPVGLRQILSQALNGTNALDFAPFYKLMGVQEKIPSFHLKLRKLIAALHAKDGIEFYYLLRAHWKSSDVVLGASPFTIHGAPQLDDAGLLDQMLFLDMQTYLPDDILTKVDRASMALSLEARVPFLDHRLVEFAWRVPSDFKVKNGQGKWLLREVLHRYVPRELMERPKQGFGVPIGLWLKKPLRDWAEALLDQSRLRQEGYFNVKLIRSAWESHLAGKGNHEHNLWCALMFQAWLENQKR